MEDEIKFHFTRLGRGRGGFISIAPIPFLKATITKDSIRVDWLFVSMHEVNRRDIKDLFKEELLWLFGVHVKYTENNERIKDLVIFVGNERECNKVISRMEKIGYKVRPKEYE